tara:strand:- start:1361 stop:2671 length:1311 start_codon:yes stop_codon:yes gene_type:complete
MVNVFKQRERDRKKRAVPAPVIESNEVQYQRNIELAAQAARKAKTARDRCEEKRHEQKTQNAKDKMVEQQQHVADELRQLQFDADLRASEMQRNTLRRPGPATTPRCPALHGAGTPGSSASELPTPRAPTPPDSTPRFHSCAKSLADIDDVSIPNPESDGFVSVVTSIADAAVFCAPWPDGRLYTWNDLAPSCTENNQDWDFWLSPGNWSKFIQSIYNGDAPVEARGSGSYNTIYTPVSLASDTKLWPPQLKLFGAADASTNTCSVLPSQPCAFRITSLCRDDSDHDKSVPRDQALLELAHSLHMAAIGVGPQIYGAILWPWKSANPAQELQSYGLLMITDRADFNLKEYVDNVKKAFPATGALQLRPKEYFSKALKLGQEALQLCYNMATYGYIHFDIKPGKQAGYRLHAHSTHQPCANLSSFGALLTYLFGRVV